MPSVAVNAAAEAIHKIHSAERPVPGRANEQISKDRYRG